MFKKLLSYLIIFSIFYADVAHCGNVGGKGIVEYLENSEEVGSSSVSVRRNTNDAETAEDRTKTQFAPPLGSSHNQKPSADYSDIPDWNESLPPGFSFLKSAHKAAAFQAQDYHGQLAPRAV